MDTKREQERKELFSSIWKIADNLRGAVDGWDFKNYVLGFMFYRFISENLTNYINADEYKSGNKDFDYAFCNDNEVDEEIKSQIIEEKGLCVLVNAYQTTHNVLFNFSPLLYILVYP